MNIYDMPAGAELDKLIAIKIFGWKPFRPCDVKLHAFDASMYGHSEDWYVIVSGKPPRTHMIDAMMLPYFSRNIDAAWQVVEKMKLLGFWFSTDRRSETWDVTFENVETCREFDASANTAPLAISRAALAACGVTEAP